MEKKSLPFTCQFWNMSGIILEAENAHDIEELSIAVGTSSFNTVKIVPLRYFDDVIKKLES